MIYRDIYAQDSILVGFVRLFVCEFRCVLVVSGRFCGPGLVKTARGDLIGRVLTIFYPNRTTEDLKKRKNLPVLTSTKA